MHLGGKSKIFFSEYDLLNFTNLSKLKLFTGLIEILITVNSFWKDQNPIFPQKSSMCSLFYFGENKKALNLLEFAGILRAQQTEVIL